MMAGEDSTTPRQGFGSRRAVRIAISPPTAESRAGVKREDQILACQRTNLRSQLVFSSCHSDGRARPTDWTGSLFSLAPTLRSGTFGFPTKWLSNQSSRCRHATVRCKKKEPFASSPLWGNLGSRVSPSVWSDAANQKHQCQLLVPLPAFRMKTKSKCSFP